MDNLYDVVIVGGGGAGLTAAIYLARAKYRVVVVEKDRFGGQIAITDEIVNYPGIERVSGAVLGETMRRQAQNFGAEFLAAEVEALEPAGDVKTVRTSRGALRCFGIVLATGASPRKIGFKGEADFQGKGVAYCATCDGAFFAGKEVFVVGGGFAAAEEGVFLTKYASHVTILVRKADFSCAASTSAAARNHEKITVLCNTVLEEVSGDKALRSVRYRDVVTGETTERRAPEGDSFGVFVFAGYVPATDLVRDMVRLDEQGYVLVDHLQRTNIEGIYAAGDVCAKNLRQMVTATADGAVAAAELEKYVSAMHVKTGLHPVQPETAPPVEEKARQTEAGAAPGSLFGVEMRTQLAGMFAKMARPLRLRLTLDDRPVSGELRSYMEELAGLTDKIVVEGAPAGQADAFPPCVRVCLADGTDTGIAFHGVPGGHEFTSFALALYNASGPGQALDEEIRQAILAIDRPVAFQILVSLSCTMCPDTVGAAQRMAAENPRVTAEAYDLNHFPELRDRYNVMSVPCTIVNGETVSFGRKGVREMLELIR